MATTQDVTGDACTTVADVQAVDAVSAPAVKAAVTPSFATPGATWVVNTTDDLPDAAPGDRICATSAGTCSLRAAIDEANRRNGDDEIDFNIPGGAPQTIQLTGSRHHGSTPRTRHAVHQRLHRSRAPTRTPTRSYSNAVPGVGHQGLQHQRPNATALYITAAATSSRACGSRAPAGRS